MIWQSRRAYSYSATSPIQSSGHSISRSRPEPEQMSRRSSTASISETGEPISSHANFLSATRTSSFVADAPAAQIYKFFSALNQVTGPILTGL